MKKLLVIIGISLFAVHCSLGQIDKDFGKALALDALKNSKDIVAGSGTAFININGFNLDNSSGPLPVNYNYFIGTSSYTALENFPKFYNVLEFTAGKLHANMPGHSGNELNLFNASSLNSYYLTAETAIGYRVFSKKTFYIGIESGPYFDMLAKMELHGNGMTEKDYSYGNMIGVNWGWSGGITAGFRSLFVNYSAGKTFKNYSKIEGTEMTIPFQMRLSVGFRFSSKYGKKDIEKINNIRKGKLKEIKKSF